MKVCIVSDYLPQYHRLWSGAELIATTLGELLMERSCEVFFLTTPRDFLTVDDHNNIYFVNTAAKRLGAVSRNFPIDIRALWDIYKTLKAEKPDVVHINAKYLFLPTVITCLRLKIPIVFTVPDYFIFCPTTFIRKPNGSSCTTYHGAHCYDCLPILSKGPIKKLVQHVPKFIMKALLALRAEEFNYFLQKVDAYVTLTNASKNRLVEYDIPEKKVHVIYHYKLTTPRESKVDITNPSAVFVGWLSEENGTDILIEAFAKITKTIGDAKLYLVGTGQYGFVEKIKKQIANYNIANRIIFLGRKDNAEALSIISKCDVVVVPHQWPKEFGPVILLEALSLGKPVITSRVGATEEFIRDDENGFLVSTYKAPSAFAEKLMFLFTNPERIARMGQKARKSISPLFGKSSTAKMLKLYESLVNEGNC